MSTSATMTIRIATDTKRSNWSGSPLTPGAASPSSPPRRSRFTSSASSRSSTAFSAASPTSKQATSSPRRRDGRGPGRDRRGEERQGVTLTKRPRKAPGRPGTAHEAKRPTRHADPMGALEQHVAIVGHRQRQELRRPRRGRSAARGRPPVRRPDPTGVSVGSPRGAAGAWPTHPGGSVATALTSRCRPRLGAALRRRCWSNADSRLWWIPAVSPWANAGASTNLPRRPASREPRGVAPRRRRGRRTRAPAPLPDQTTVLHEMDRIVRRGMRAGFRVLMITQRPRCCTRMS